MWNGGVPDPADMVDVLLMQALTRKAAELERDRDRGRARLTAAELSRLFPRK